MRLNRIKDLILSWLPRLRKTFRAETKVFLSLFAVSCLLCFAVAVSAYSILTSEIQTQFEDRYQTLAKLLSTTLTNYENQSEAIMKNAAQLVKLEDAKRGLLSTSDLTQLARQIGVTHLFMIDQNGKFIRSTNEDPNLVPNLFSFCRDYRELLTGRLEFEATPLIPTNPDPRPHKFYSIANHDRTRIIHLALKAGFIDGLLKKIIQDDGNIEQLELYSPNGMILGSFGKTERPYVPIRNEAITKSAGVSERTAEGFVFSNWIDSTHLQCCQCANAGNLREGKYQYLVRAIVSPASLDNAINRIGLLTIQVFLAACLLSAILARIVSRRLVYRLQALTTQIRSMTSQGAVLAPIRIEGDDEIAEVGASFDDLIERYRLTQRELLAFERQKAITETATRVAHDIRSPLTSINMVLASLKDLPPEKRALLTAATARVNAIADDLLRHQRSSSTTALARPNLARVRMDFFFEAVSEELRTRYIPQSKIEMRFVNSARRSVQCDIDEINLYRAINNCVNNAIEAMPAGGTLTLGLQVEGGIVSIVILDNGIGIPPELLAKLGKEKISVGKTGLMSGSGLGVYTAFETIRQMGGTVLIQSRVGQGTLVKMSFAEASGEALIEPPIC